jgi:hypothetical protein
MKKTMINPHTMYSSSNLKYVPAKIIVDITNPANTDIPPRFGTIFLCDVRPLLVAQRFFNLETFTIDGIVNQVIPNAIKNPRMISTPKGIDIVEMLKGKVKIQVFR